MTPILQKLEKETFDAKTKPDGLPVIDLYLKEAKKAKNDSCIMKAYKRKLYYYIVTKQQFTDADRTFTQLKKEKIGEPLKTNVKFTIIYCYQYIGQTLKAISLCREILQTSKNKVDIVNASYNISLFYYNCRLFDTAIDKAKDLCQLSESITDKSTFHYNLSIYKIYMAMLLIEADKPRQALPYLMETDSIIKNDPKDCPSVSGMELDFVPYVWGEYYSAINNDKQFWNKIAELERYKSDGTRRLIYELKFRYYIKRKDYPKAKEAMDLFQKTTNLLGMKYDDAGYMLISAKIAKGLKDYPRATELYDRYVSKSDSLSHLADILKTNEYGVQLNLDKANIEKSELKAKVNHYRVQILLLITIITLMIAICATWFVIYLRRTNKKLHLINEELKNSYDKVDTLGKMKNNLIMNMSREIREQLSAISGFSQIISSTDGELKEYGKIIETNSCKISDILDEVITSTKLEKGEIAQESVNVNECCQAALLTIKNKIPEGVKIIYSPSDKSLDINSSYRWLIQVISNLLDNACKFTVKGQIILKYAVEGSHLHLSVTDTGCGIPSDKAEWVFEHFTKINKFVKGTGLGLSVCRMITVKLDGSISIDTSYHDGCKVDVLLSL